LDEKDLRTDVLNIVLGEEKFSYRTKTGTLQTVDSQFTSAERFFEEVSALPQVSVLSTSGHSLGGALAQKVAAKHKIPAFTYSTAGVYPQLTDSETEWLSGDGKVQVVNFIHEGDQVSSWTDAKKYGTALLCEEFSDKTLLSGHFLTSYHFDKEGHVKLLKKGNPSKSKK
ncbi:MAG: acetylxylan esterase, partial [Streptococcaceae bacterium]|nr:acetylxylan esterase [Streptococcaceae bacterium]